MPKTVTPSLSARRAWIEMSTRSQPSKPRAVALRKESVDRNARKIRCVAPDVSSLSARRAWIEIIDYVIDYVNDASLSARRAWIEMRLADMSAAWNRSLSARRAWIEMKASLMLICG